MRRFGIPITRQNYLDFAYMGEVPAELSAEAPLRTMQWIKLRSSISAKPHRRSSHHPWYFDAIIVQAGTQPAICGIRPVLRASAFPPEPSPARHHANLRRKVEVRDEE